VVLIEVSTLKIPVESMYSVVEYIGFSKHLLESVRQLTDRRLFFG